MDETTTIVAPVPGAGQTPIADFEIKSRIGEGAFGQVFLGLSTATGRYRAIKVVRRSRFDSDHPYDVEFAGLKRFEEVSREHEGFVDILHVTRDDQAGFFSYVMELADDLETAQQIDPARYVPRTLAKELAHRKRLPPAECIRVGLALTAALAELHRRDLVHRDVNPRNVIFVRGAPKLADVGLVTEAHSQPHTLIGTPDYMDPPVHGTPGGDLFSFGKLLYTITTGLPPGQWPDSPLDFGKSPDAPVLTELEAIWRKACDLNRSSRYAEVAEIHAELLALQAGASVLRYKRFERALGWLRRYGLLLGGLFVCAGGVLYFRQAQLNQAAELRHRKVGSFVANGNHAVESADLLGALSWFAEAWRLDSRADNDSVHRIRIGSLLQRAPGLVQMWFHDRQLKEAYFAGHANQVIMSDVSGRWQVYDLGFGQPLYHPFGMGLPDESVSLSSRTARALTFTSGDRLWLWQYQTGAQLGEFRCPEQEVQHAALSPDGAWIAAAASHDREESLLLWSTAAPGSSPVVLGRHPKGTHAVAFSPNSRFLLTVGRQNQAHLWDIQTRALTTTFTNHQDWIFRGSFRPDSQAAVTASFDRSARVWDTSSGQLLARFPHDDGVFAAEFNSDGSRLVTAGLDFTVRIWDPASQELLHVLRHNSKVLRAEFSPGDRFLLTSCFDDTVRVWHLPKAPQARRVNGVLAGGGLLAIVRTNDSWTVTERVRSGGHSLELPAEQDLTWWFAPDDRFVAAAAPADPPSRPELRARIFDVQTARAMSPSLSLPAGWSNLVVSAGGRWLLGFGSEGGAIWSTAAGKRAHSLEMPFAKAVFSPDGRLLALARRNQVEVLDVERGFLRVAGWSHPPNATVGAMQWDGASRRLLTCGWNGTFTPLSAQIWLARTGEPIGRALEHRDGVLYAAFSHDGTRAITCGEDFMAILWDAATGRALAPPLRHRHQVFQAAFSADDRLVVTASINDTLSVWSAETGEPLASLVLPLVRRSQRISLRFTADNRTLLIRDATGQSYSWELPFYSGSIDDLLLRGQLLSAQQTDSNESLQPHSKEWMRAIWGQLRSKYPADFTLPPE